MPAKGAAVALNDLTADGLAALSNHIRVAPVPRELAETAGVRVMKMVKADLDLRLGSQKR